MGKIDKDTIIGPIDAWTNIQIYDQAERETNK
jgi:hypothetical protein